MPVSFCSVSPHHCSEGIIRVFIGLRLFEIAVFLFCRYFGATTTPTIATNYNHEPTTLKPSHNNHLNHNANHRHQLQPRTNHAQTLTTTTTTIFATTRAYERRPPRTTRRRFPRWKPSKNARRIDRTKALGKPAWTFPA